MFEREIEFASMEAAVVGLKYRLYRQAPEIADDDWHDIASQEACVRLPDGSKWVMADPERNGAWDEGWDIHDKQLFNAGQKSDTFGGRLEQESARKIVEHDWRSMEFHDVFTRIDSTDARAYCTDCGWINLNDEAIIPPAYRED